jgi:hypothetical protein
VSLFPSSQAALDCAAHGLLKGTHMRHYKPQEINWYKSKTAIVRLRFMFHYYIPTERRAPNPPRPMATSSSTEEI